MLHNSLVSLGFSPSERKIYLHLLEGGPSYATQISAQTQLNRTNVYEALDRLISKGVVAFIAKNNVKWYNAQPSRFLFSLVEEKQGELTKLKQTLESEIRHIHKKVPPQPLDAEIFVGKHGLRMLFEEMLKVGKPIHLIASELQFQKLFGPYFELWHKVRAKKKIRQYSIFPRRFSSIVKSRPFLEYKFMDDKFTSPTTTIIYGEVCLLIEWSKEPIALKIENKKMAASHRNYFGSLWDSL